MQTFFFLYGCSQIPVSAGCLTIQLLFNISHQPFYINHRMTTKDLGQAIGQITDQTTAGTLMEIQKKTEAVCLGIIIGKA